MTDDALFDGCSLGRERLKMELDRGRMEAVEPWWDENDGQWFGEFFAFWHKSATVPCEPIRYRIDRDAYDATRFGAPPGTNKPKAKLCITGKTSFETDDTDPHLKCSPTNWGVAEVWAKEHTGALLEDPSISLFGLKGKLAFPAVGGTHTALITQDGFVILSLRSEHQHYYPLTWSASYEESISPRSPVDLTLGRTIVRGAYEEFGITASAVQETTCLAVGREFAQDGDVLQLNPSVLCGMRVALDIEEIWTRLKEKAPSARDKSEHRAWVGINWSDEAALHRFLRRARRTGVHPTDKRSSRGIEIDLGPHARRQRSSRPLMPTSAARIFMLDRWLREKTWVPQGREYSRLKRVKVRQLLAAGQESSLIEWKAAAFADRQGERHPELTRGVLQTIAAFLNTDGGIVLIGVEPKRGEIVGLDQDLKVTNSLQRWEEQLVDKIKSQIGNDAAAAVQVSHERVSGSVVGRIQCPAHDSPVQLRWPKDEKDDSKGSEQRLYRRVNSKDEYCANPLEAIEYYKQRWRHHE